MRCDAMLKESVDAILDGDHILGPADVLLLEE